MQEYLPKWLNFACDPDDLKLEIIAGGTTDHLLPWSDGTTPVTHTGRFDAENGRGKIFFFEIPSTAKRTGCGASGVGESLVGSA